MQQQNTYSTTLSFATDKESKCKYWLPEQTYEAEYSCNYAMENPSETFCIFHAKKFTEEEKQNLSKFVISRAEVLESKFQAAFAELLESAEKQRNVFIDLRGFKFPQVSFKSKFPEKADFSFSVFYYDVNFSIPVITLNPDDPADTNPFLMLEEGAIFRNTTFKKNADFNYIEIKGDLDFQNAIFEKDALFNSIVVKEKATFSGCVFNAKSEFISSSFKELEFYNATFLQKAEFQNIKVQQSSDFDGTTFNGEANFIEASFGENAFDFDAFELKKNDQLETETESLYSHSSFIGAIFNEKADFFAAVFFNRAEFQDAVFRKHTRFVSYDADTSPIEVQRFGMFHNGCDFIRVTLPKDEKFVFFRNDLSKARFHDTNLEEIIFRDVQWAKAQTRLQRLLRGKSYFLWDEIRPMEGMRDYPDDAKTAENYRQLVINYEGKRDYETAEYFHIGEMEMRRKRLEENLFSFEPIPDAFSEPEGLDEDWHKSKLYYLNYPFYLFHELRKKVNGYSIYLISSRYGTSYPQAIAILFLLTLMFPLFFLYAGFKSGKESTVEQPRIIEYNLFSDSTHQTVAFGQWINDYSEALSYTLSIITFQRERFYEPLNLQSRMLLYISVFVLTAQTAFVLLAIRRQFKR
jgi:uncharacterized protein YjbI with pentapeptide repeats